MENIIVTTLPDGMLKIKAAPGYILYNDLTQRQYQEATVKSTRGFRAVLSGVEATPHRRTLEDARREKLAALSAYDASAAVNSFRIGGAAVWIAPDERANYILTLQGAKRRDIAQVSFLGQTIPVDSALAMLDAVNLYAMQCVGVTAAHRAAIEQGQNIDAVDAYDFTAGYPEKLQF